MAHDRFEFEMPAPCDVVFDAFHYHQWRARWDSLVSQTNVLGGAPCPSVGAISENTGSGWMRKLSMKTRFVSYARPRIAAATMVGDSFPFLRWSASMQHREKNEEKSIMIYTYTFETYGKSLRWIIEPIVKCVFDWQTRRRFERLKNYLALNKADIKQWQCSRRSESENQ
jgi:hypothetical protein